MIAVQSKLTGDFAEGLERFGRTVQTNILRVGAQAMAQQVYDEVRRIVPVSKHGHVFHGTHSTYYFPAGTLKESIYQVYSHDRSKDGRATYHVSWNHKKAPYGFMVEFGTSRAPAHPFMRGAWSNVHGKLLASAKNAMSDRFAMEFNSA